LHQRNIKRYSKKRRKSQGTFPLSYISFTDRRISKNEDKDKEEISGFGLNIRLVQDCLSSGTEKYIQDFFHEKDELLTVNNNSKIYKTF